MTVFFTADTHFSHRMVLQYDQRPWYCVEEMNEKMVARWNATVKPDDTVFHLGDVSMGKPNEVEWAGKLNGHLRLIEGNHDKDKRKRALFPLYFEEVYKRDKIIELEGLKIYMCHFPPDFNPYLQNKTSEAWQGTRDELIEHCDLLLYGHIHRAYQGWGVKSVNVGCVCWNYRPIALDQILERLHSSKREESERW